MLLLVALLWGTMLGCVLRARKQAESIVGLCLCLVQVCRMGFVIVHAVSKESRHDNLGFVGLFWVPFSGLTFRAAAAHTH